MTSATLSSDVVAIKMTDLRVPKINGDSWCYIANLYISVCIHSMGDLSTFECVHGFEKPGACAHEAQKMHFHTPRRAIAHAH